MGSLTATERVAWFIAGFASGGAALLCVALMRVSRDPDQ